MYKALLDACEVIKVGGGIIMRIPDETEELLVAPFKCPVCWGISADKRICVACGSALCLAYCSYRRVCPFCFQINFFSGGRALDVTDGHLHWGPRPT